MKWKCGAAAVLAVDAEECLHKSLMLNVAAAAAAAVPISTRRGYVVWARPRETLLDPLLMWVMAWTVRAMA